MKSNKDILNEAFFKKVDPKEKLKRSLPQYSPIQPEGGNVFNSVYNVIDTDEAKKRIAGTFGATFGSNNIKSMASKAIKQFPILVSDNVEPETVIMLKKLMEEQYAEYINLLVSNQVIDLSSYVSDGENGNIAIQALDTISGTDFRKSRIADKAASGKISADDVFKNVPLYNLLKENNLVLNTGDDILDTLFENACILPSNEVDSLITYIQENASEINEVMNEATRQYVSNPTFRKDGKVTLKSYSDALYSSDEVAKREKNKNINIDALRGFVGYNTNGKEIYDKLTTADIVLDKDAMDHAVNMTVGEILVNPENAALKDKFEKATLLLQANRIAGIEYVQYLNLRLGIPVSQEARLELARRFPISSVRNWSSDNPDRLLTEREMEAISKNRRITETIAKKIMSSTLSNCLYATAGATVGGGTAAILALAASAPIFLPVVAGAAVGGGAFLLYNLIKRSKSKKAKIKQGRLTGWERVEALIAALEEQRADLVAGNNYPQQYESNLDTTLSKTKAVADIRSNALDLVKFEKAQKEVESMLSRALTESERVDNKNYSFIIDEELISAIDEEIFNLAEELAEDKDLMKEIMLEARVNKINTLLKEPVQIKYIEKKPGQDVLYTPSYAARSTYAYGSTEIERKENKDRRYDQPLIMTVKFKERFADGKYSDNELTAVIGILGKVIRIPSEEMQYILKENIEGNTLEGFFKNSNKGLLNSISDLMTNSKISKSVKGLPQSADVWYNLEKVATLAAANKISGRRTNNIANAHIIFSQREIDNIRTELGIDYLRDAKKTSTLMKRYSAFTIMIANDPGQRVYIFDDQDNISWNVVPYTALAGKDGGDQLNAVLSKISRL